MTISRISALLAVSLFVSSVASAHGNVSCDVPKSEWRPRVELQKQLKSVGWTIRDIKIQNGCYEVYGFDEKSARVEAFFNPKTFDRVLPSEAKPAP
jgi:hypothetical protein